MVDAFETSGLTRLQFASRHGIGVHRLDYWLKRLERDDGPERSTTSQPPRFVPVEPSFGPDPTADSSPVTVTAPNGWRVDLRSDCDLTTLASVIEAIHGATR